LGDRILGLVIANLIYKKFSKRMKVNFLRNWLI